MTFGDITGILKKSKVAARRKSWKDAKRFVCWDADRALFNIMDDGIMKIWYWGDAEEFREAVEDLNADDWALVSGI